MDTLDTVDVSVEPNDYIGIDEENRKIYVGTGSTNYLLSRYSLEEDNTVNLELKKDTGGYSPGNIALSPDNSRLLITRGNSVCVYNTSDFSIMGKWNFNYTPYWAIFSPDVKSVYTTFASTSEDFIYVLDTQRYTISRRLPFPDGGYEMQAVVM